MNSLTTPPAAVIRGALTVCLLLLHSAAAGAAPLSMPIRGISYFSFQAGTLADNTQGPTLDFIAATGANWICLTTLHIYDPASNQIKDSPTQTDFAGLAPAIANAKQRGLKVLLRVTIEVIDQNGSNQALGTIAPPADASGFFSQYKTLLLRYATLARNQGADMLSVGSESHAFAGPVYRAYWVDMIGAVRSVFAGKITYGAYPNLALPATLANLETVDSFWDQLDYLGFSIYPRLSTSANPTRQDLEEGWRHNWYSGIDNIGVLQLYSALTGKQILITDHGYPSANGAAANPGDAVRYGTGVPNNRLQALLYDVMFSAFNARSGNWLAGMFLWEIPASNAADSPGLRTWLETDYTFLGKPAGDVVAAWYSESPAAIRRMADRVFDRVEATYAGILSPSAVPSQQSGGYYFRYYSRTENYLGVLGNRLLYFDPNAGGIRDLGTLTSWFVDIH